MSSKCPRNLPRPPSDLQGNRQERLLSVAQTFQALCKPLSGTSQGNRPKMLPGFGPSPRRTLQTFSRTPQGNRPDSQAICMTSVRIPASISPECPQEFAKVSHKIWRSTTSRNASNPQEIEKVHEFKEYQGILRFTTKVRRVLEFLRIIPRFR